MGKSIWCWVVRAFGLRGSWWWAVRQMEAGRVVTRGAVVGALKYRMDDPGNRLLLSTFRAMPFGDAGWDWKPAYVFAVDIEATDWILVEDLEGLFDATE